MNLYLSFRRKPEFVFCFAGCRIKSAMTEFENPAFSAHIDPVIPAEAVIQFAIGHPRDHAGMTEKRWGGT